MGQVEKLERKTKKMQDTVNIFEKSAKKQGLDLTREDGDTPIGYWYCSNETNVAFRWFLSGISYGELIAR